MRHRRGVHEVLAKNGWQEHYIAGQLAELDVLSDEPLPRICGNVYVCEVEECLSGFDCVECSWRSITSSDSTPLM